MSRSSGKKERQVFTDSKAGRLDLRKVEDHEDAFVSRSSKVLHRPAGLGPVIRPAYSSLGTEITLWTNYFETTFENRRLTIYQYDIKVDLESGSKSTALSKNSIDAGSKPKNRKKTEPKALVGAERKQIIKLALEDPYFEKRKGDFSTNWKTLVLGLDPQIPTFHQIVRVDYKKELKDAPKPEAGIYNVKFTPVKGAVKKIEVRHLLDYVEDQATNVKCEDKDEIVSALNMFFSRYARMANSTVMIGGKRCFLRDDQQLPDYWKSHQHELFGKVRGGLTCGKGFFVGVRPASAGVLLNVNVTTGTFWKTNNLASIIRELKRESRCNNEDPELEHHVRGLKVDMLHINDKNQGGERIPRIQTVYGFATNKDGLGSDNPPVASNGATPRAVTFWCASSKDPGSNVSVADYFRSRYGTWLRDTDDNIDENIPVINIGSQAKPVYVPAMACQVTAGQHFKGKLSSRQLQDVGKISCRLPHENAYQIKAFSHNMIGVKQGLKNSGIQLSDHLLRVHGRLLGSPSIRYGGTSRKTTNTGSWDTKGVQLLQPMELKKWVLLFVNQTPNKSADFAASLGLFREVMKKLGLKNEAPTAASRPLYIDQNGSDDKLGSDAAEENLDRLFKGYHNQNIDLVFVLLSNENALVYNKIKRSADVRCGVRTLCIQAQSKNFLQKLRTPSEKSKAARYHANVTLKVNTKLGGLNHGLEDKKLGIIDKGNTMVVGIDVTHPAAQAKVEAPSIAAMVANIDGKLGQWPADLQLQRASREEMIFYVGDMLETRLRLWKDKNGTFPENILVYRDGVSEGQYQQLIDFELWRMRVKTNLLYGENEQLRPNFTLIVVGKDHNTRFYPTDMADTDKYSNNKPGTLVDRGVTDLRLWDFYLQSHTTIKGTAQPAHYVVLVNEVFQGSSQDVVNKIQSVTYHLCYLYGRSTASVSVCTPVYYADIACDRARRYLPATLFKPVKGDKASNTLYKKLRSRPARKQAESNPSALPATSKLSSATSKWSQHLREGNKLKYTEATDPQPAKKPSTPAKKVELTQTPTSAPNAPSLPVPTDPTEATPASLPSAPKSRKAKREAWRAVKAKEKRRAGAAKLEAQEAEQARLEPPEAAEKQSLREAKPHDEEVAKRFAAEEEATQDDIEQSIAMAQGGGIAVYEAAQTSRPLAAEGKGKGKEVVEMGELKEDMGRLTSREEGESVAGGGGGDGEGKGKKKEEEEKDEEDGGLDTGDEAEHWTGLEPTQAMRDAIRIHDALREYMFYL